MGPLTQDHDGARGGKDDTACAAAGHELLQAPTPFQVSQQVSSCMMPVSTSSHSKVVYTLILGQILSCLQHAT